MEKHGYVVIDTANGELLASQNPDLKFRIASVIKPWIAADFAERFMAARGAESFVPDDVPEFFRERLEVMLRSSNNAAVDAFWDEPADYPDADPASMWPNNGNVEVVSRIAERMGLQHTVPPPREILFGYWGFALTSAVDIARSYQHLLADDRGIGRFVLAELGRATRIARDDDGEEMEQFFGIPDAMGVPAETAQLSGEFALKQGWSGVSLKNEKVPEQAKHEAARGERWEQLFDTVAHTTGVIPRPGGGAPLVVVVMSAYPGLWDKTNPTTVQAATEKLTGLTRHVFKKVGIAPPPRPGRRGGPGGGFDPSPHGLGQPGPGLGGPTPRR